MGPGGAFTATISDIGYDGGYYTFATSSGDLLDGGSDGGGQVPVEAGGTEDIEMTFYDSDGVGNKLSIYDVEISEEGTLIGTAADQSAQGMETPIVPFAATRVDPK